MDCAVALARAGLAAELAHELLVCRATVVPVRTVVVKLRSAIRSGAPAIDSRKSLYAEPAACGVSARVALNSLER